MIESHELYTDTDFTDEECDRGNPLARLVVDGGLAICKKCGKGEADLETPCHVGPLPEIALVVCESCLVVYSPEFEVCPRCGCARTESDL